MIALGMFASFAGQAAVVYKWTDANGVVHFSDQPEPGAEKVITSSGDPTTNAATTGSGTMGRAAQTTSKSTPPKPKPTDVMPYTLISIVAPTAQQTFVNEPVAFHLVLEPDLLEGQTITWYLNGAPVTDQSPIAEQFVLQNMARGAYTISATITDVASSQTMSSAPVTFYVRQPSELAPQQHRTN
jgi:membrane carboxypeptidase/penicillin-binding protein PbpC